MPQPSPIESLHIAWCQLNNIAPNELRIQFYVQSYQSFLFNGFTEADLRLVVKYIQRQNQKMTMKRKISIRSVVDDLARFNEDLCEARRLQSRAPTVKEKSLGELRGFIPDRETKPAQSLGELLRKAVQ